MKTDKRTKSSCGADQTTPSYAQYFTWLNNTNEGSNEGQTLANLEFFEYLHKKYGMILDIYAWDAGNMDGAKKTYADFSQGKLKKQYPNGYLPVVEKAKSIGTRMGVWGGTDGYGKTPEEEKSRRDFLVHLCKDYHFALFKFDRVCGKLRPWKRKAFAKTMQECRSYCPDLILLLHRNKVGKAYIYATTDLWQRKETYVDGNSYNACTAPHHRAFAFTRGLTPDLSRLMEDHGVCISSFNDYFEDDLIIQAFGRCLILSPEIYGNPFFLRDDEYAILARIFNLHRKYRDILVNGIVLPPSYGIHAVARGDGNRKFLCMSNPSWTEKDISIRLQDLSFPSNKRFFAIAHFPYERYLGSFDKNQSITVTIPPFRACLVEVVQTEKADKFLIGCDYFVLHERDGQPDEVKIVRSKGSVLKGEKNTISPFSYVEPFDNLENKPVYLGSLQSCPVPENQKQLYESAMFAISNDSWESRALIRAGKTSIPQVQKARDFFFNQDTYRYRGTESKVLFDGNQDTFFDTEVPPFIQSPRLQKGTLRVDLGQICAVDTIEIEYFEPSKNIHHQTPPQHFHKVCEYSCDLISWKKKKMEPIQTVKSDYVSKVVVERVNNIVDLSGKLQKAVFTVQDDIRYFLLPNPMYRIHTFVAKKDGKVIPLRHPKANNLMAPFERNKTISCQKGTVTIPKHCKTAFLSVAVNGYHGKEGVYCVATIEDKAYGMFDRAPSFPINVWQHEPVSTDSNNTYYLDITEEMKGKEVTVYALFNKRFIKIQSIDVYLCSKHLEIKGTVLKI